MKKEEIKKGDILQKKFSDDVIAYVRNITKNGIAVYINNTRDIILNEQLHHWEFACPIKDGRLICNETFAVRFKQFLEWIPKEWWMSQPHYYEEYEYLMNMANRLLKYQIQTASDDTEISYLKRLNLIEDD